MENNNSKRYEVRNAQLGVDTHLRKIREPWKVIDTTTNRVIDEYSSKRAALDHCKQLNQSREQG